MILLLLYFIHSKRILSGKDMKIRNSDKHAIFMRTKKFMIHMIEYI